MLLFPNRKCSSIKESKLFQDQIIEVDGKDPSIIDPIDILSNVSIK